MEATARRVAEAVEAFLLAKRVGNLSTHTLDAYRRWLGRFCQTGGAADPLVVRRFFSDLQGRGLKPSSVHTAYRTLKTFFRWCLEVGAITEDPLRGFAVRVPRTLPSVPTEDELRATLEACSDSMEGIRNRVLILTLADSGLRASEVLHLLIEDWRAADRGLFIRAGKGRKERVAFVGPTTTRALRAWLTRHPALAPESFLFTDSRGRPLKRRHLIQILHRLSRKAGLPEHRRLHPHLLRHWAATSWLRGGAGLDEVRRLLRHESLNTTLRYSSLVGADLQRAHKRAGASERLHLAWPNQT